MEKMEKYSDLCLKLEEIKKSFLHHKTVLGEARSSLRSLLKEDVEGEDVLKEISEKIFLLEECKADLQKKDVDINSLLEKLKNIIEGWGVGQHPFLKDKDIESLKIRERKGLFKIWHKRKKIQEKVKKEQQNKIADLMTRINESVKVLDGELKSTIDKAINNLVKKMSEKDLLFPKLFCRIKIVKEKLSKSKNFLDYLKDYFSEKRLKNLQTHLCELNKQDEGLESSLIEKRKRMESVVEEKKTVSTKEYFANLLFEEGRLNSEVRDIEDNVVKIKEEVCREEKRLSETLGSRAEYDVFEHQIDNLIAECDIIKGKLGRLEDKNYFFDINLILAVCCSYISKTFSADVGLLKKWTSNGKKAIVLSYFTSFFCFDRQGREEQIMNAHLRYGEFNFGKNFDVVQKIPLKHRVLDADGVKGDDSESITAAERDFICSSESCILSREEEKAFLSKPAFAFTALCDSSAGFKSNPIWKEWTEEDEEVIHFYSKNINFIVNHKFIKCDAASVSAKSIVI